jgi:D-xylose transport system ATP-binding protein
VRIPSLTLPVGLMSGGQRQAIAVARAVAFATKVVLLDEPTAALGLRESRQVLDLVRSLPQHGVSVILISHNLEHVIEVADRAVVLRRGRIVGEEIPTPETHERLVSLIVGGAGTPTTNGHDPGVGTSEHVPQHGAGSTS